MGTGEPLLTEQEAEQRAAELIASFERHPDALSPDEQALVMTLLIVCGERDDLAERLRVVTGKKL